MLQSNGTPPQITTGPEDLFVEAGSTATFRVVASSSTGLSYQWKRNGLKIPGAVSSTYTFTPALSDSGAKFKVIVSNLSGTVTSAEKTVAVGIVPQILTLPASLSVKAGEVAEFSTSASGSNPMIYQWKRGSFNIAGANSATYRFTPNINDNGVIFSVLAINAFGIATSANATLTVRPASTSASTLNITGRLLPERIAKNDFHLELSLGEKTYHSDNGCNNTDAPCFSSLSSAGWQLRNNYAPLNFVLV